MSEMSQLQLSKFESILDYEIRGEEQLVKIERKLGRAVLTMEGEELHRKIVELRKEYRRTAESIKNLRNKANLLWAEMMEE